MRTTVTLDPDAEALLRRRMVERHLSMKEALNQAVRMAFGASTSGSQPFRSPTADLGVPMVNLDRALQLAAELEDDELLRKAQVGK